MVAMQTKFLGGKVPGLRVEGQVICGLLELKTFLVFRWRYKKRNTISHTFLREAELQVHFCRRRSDCNQESLWIN